MSLTLKQASKIMASSIAHNSNKRKEISSSAIPSTVKINFFGIGDCSKKCQTEVLAKHSKVFREKQKLFETNYHITELVPNVNEDLLTASVFDQWFQTRVWMETISNARYPFSIVADTIFDTIVAAYYLQDNDYLQYIEQHPSYYRNTKLKQQHIIELYNIDTALVQQFSAYVGVPMYLENKDVTLVMLLAMQHGEVIITTTHRIKRTFSGEFQFEPISTPTRTNSKPYLDTDDVKEAPEAPKKTSSTLSREPSDYAPRRNLSNQFDILASQQQEEKAAANGPNTDTYVVNSDDDTDIEDQDDACDVCSETFDCECDDIETRGGRYARMCDGCWNRDPYAPKKGCYTCMMKDAKVTRKKDKLRVLQNARKLLTTSKVARMTDEEFDAHCEEPQDMSYPRLA